MQNYARGVETGRRETLERTIEKLKGSPADPAAPGKAVEMQPELAVINKEVFRLDDPRERPPVTPCSVPVRRRRGPEPARCRAALSRAKGDVSTMMEFGAS